MFQIWTNVLQYKIRLHSIQSIEITNKNQLKSPTTLLFTKSHIETMRYCVLLERGNTNSQIRRDIPIVLDFVKFRNNYRFKKYKHTRTRIQRNQTSFRFFRSTLL